MAELKFAVQTDLARIENTPVLANFDEALAAVKEIVAPYQNLVVTPETVRNAASDRARLRKLREAVDGQRKAVKECYMKPVNEFTAAAKPILDEIDKAVNNIDVQVKAFEEQERKDKMDALRAFFAEKNTGAGADFADFDKIAARHPDWKNKGCTPEKAQSDIIIELSGIDRGIMALRGYPDNYRAMMLEKFAERYDLADAINVFTQIKRREEQEKALAQREAERKAKEEAERAAAKDGETDSSASLGMTEEERIATVPMEPRNDESAGRPAVRHIEFWVEVTQEQGKALGAWLKANGIRYGKVQKGGGA